MIEVEGADQLAALAKALKDAGEKDLQREMYAAINRAVKPLREDIKQSARDNLPSRGGLAALVGKSRLTTQRRTSSRAAGVRVVAKNRLSLYHLDQGVVRHRVKGKRPEQWPVQRIRPGWWTNPTTEAAPEVRAELVRALNDIAAKLERVTGA